MKELKEKYDQLKPYIKDKFWNRYAEGNEYGLHLTSAFSKSYEFNVLVNNESNDQIAFFLSPVLRGICEDLIVLKFLKKHRNLSPNSVLKNYMQVQLKDIIVKQTKFFEQNHPQQIIVNSSMVRIDDKFEKALKEEWSKIGLNKEKIFPSISHMATDAGMIELYNYVYSATSDMVHFSPHVLMRSGWSKKEDEFLHHFSTENFSRYYKIFNQFYGSYLFYNFTNEFKKIIELPKNAINIINEIKEILLSESRWPELITFEEMNIPEAESIRIINALRKLKRANN